MKKWICLLMIVAIYGHFDHLAGQGFPYEDTEFQKLAQSTMTFLNIGVGARAVAMGSAFTCMENDVTALFWNPAGIAKIKGGSVSLNNTQWIADIKENAVAFAYGFDRIGTFGLSFLAMDNGSIDRTIPDPSNSRGFYPDGTFNVAQWAAGLAYGREITNKFSIGGQVKYAYQDLGNADIVEWSGQSAAFDTLDAQKNNKGILAFDFGTIYSPGFKDLRIGMSFRNFSRPVKYSFESFNLTITFKVGAAMNVMSVFSDTHDQALQLSVEAIYPYDHTEIIHVGGEYVFKNLIALRTGYRSNSDIGGFSAGFGILPLAFSGVDLSFDYTYASSEEVLGNIQLISIGFKF